MSRELQNWKELQENLLPEEHNDDKVYSQREYSRLSREDRIYLAVMHPRRYRLSDQDDRYFHLCKKTYNILFSSATETQARALISQIDDYRLSTAEVIELIRVTKNIFGRIEVRDQEFDRAVIREKLLDLIQRCRIANDLENERRAIKQLMDLDNLALKEAKTGMPVVPPLPDVQIITKPVPPGYEEAIVESFPYGEDEEE